MRPQALEYLCCPACGGDLSVTGREEAGDILQGEVTCKGCQATYPIAEGIPDFTGEAATAERSHEDARLRTQENFGYSWNNFHETEAHFEEQFLGWISPATPADFKGKVVLDAGCGMGRHAEAAAKFGAKAVLAVDFSSAVHPARRRLLAHSNVHVVRGDIYRLPLREGSCDLAYSVGVLHHLPDPAAGYHAVVSKVRAGGEVIAWVYGAENNEWITSFVSPIREKLLSHLPMPALKAASYCITAAGLYPALKLVYAPVSKLPALAPLKKRLFYSDYLSSIAPYSFRHVYGIVFDHLLAPIAFYLPRSELEAWSSSEKLEGATVRFHNGNSWTLVGRRPAAAAGRPARSPGAKRPAAGSEARRGSR